MRKLLKYAVGSFLVGFATLAFSNDYELTNIILFSNVVLVLKTGQTVLAQPVQG